MTPPPDLAAIRARLERKLSFGSVNWTPHDEDIRALLAEVDRLLLCVSEGEQAKAELKRSQQLHDATCHTRPQLQTAQQEIARLREAQQALLSCQCGSVANDIRGGNLPRLDIVCDYCDRAALTGGPAT